MHWTPVTALFLPKDFTLEKMLNYLPDRNAYALDENAVDTELKFQDVKNESDQIYIKDALSKIGKAFYHPKDARDYLIFQLRIDNGTIKTEKDY